MIRGAVEFLGTAEGQTIQGSSTMASAANVGNSRFTLFSLPHHLPSSPLPFIITSLLHHFPS